MQISNYLEYSNTVILNAEHRTSVFKGNNGVRWSSGSGFERSVVRILHWSNVNF